MKTVRTIEVRATSSGVTETTAALKGMAGAHGDVARAAETSAQVIETSARRTGTISGAYERYRRQVDDTYAAQERLNRQTRAFDQAHSAGLTTWDEHNRLIGLARDRFDRLAGANDNTTRSMGLARHEMINLGRQLQDVGTMAAMGASGMQILASQGAQVVDIFASSERGLGGWVRAVGPIAGAVAAVGGALILGAKAAWDFSGGQDSVERSLRGVGRTSGATVGGINAVAEASASSARVSVGMAREMASTFASTGKIGMAFYGDLTVTASRYARTSGLELPEATSKLAQAMADPLKGAIELNKTLGFLSGTTLELMERQSAAGDRAGAQRTLNEALKTSLLGVTEGTNAWATAWDKVSRAAKDAYDATGRALQRRFDPTLAEQIEDMRARMEPAPARRGMSPYQLAARDKRLSLPNPRQDDLAELLERQMWRGINDTIGQRETDIAQKTLAGKGLASQILPSNADMLRLTEWKTTLQEALDTGRATTGTKEALTEVNRLIAQGGTEASRLRDAARDALNAAGLRPYEAGLAAIENRYRNLIALATDPAVKKGLEDARLDERSAYRVQNTDIIQRDYRDRLDEMGRSLRFQRESFGQAPDVVETLRARMEMMNEAARTGQSVTERYGASWEALAGQMGKAKVAADELQRSQQTVIAGLDEMRSGTRGALTGVFSDLRQGRDPREALSAAFGRMSDQFLDRMVSRPLTEGLLGKDGQAGGGLLGGLVGQGLSTAAMTVNATSVTIAGLGGLTSGIPGLSTATTAGAAASGEGGGLGAIGAALAAPLAAARSLVTSGGRVLSFGTGKVGDGALPITVSPSGVAHPVSPVTSSPLPDLSLPSSISGRSAYDILGATIDARGARLGFREQQLQDQVRDRDWARFGQSGIDNPDLKAVMGPELLKRAEAWKSSLDTSSGAIDKLATSSTDASGAVGSLGSSLANALGNTGSGGFNLSGFFGSSAAPPAETVAFADGGLLSGPGGPRSDNLIVRASPGEYIVNAAATRQHMALLHSINSGRYGGAFEEGGVVPAMMNARSIPATLIDARPATAPAVSGSHHSAGPSTMVIDVKGATGNSEIAAMVERGINAAIKANNTSRDRSIGSRMENAQRRFGG